MLTSCNEINYLSKELYEYIGTENLEKIKTLAPLMQKSTIDFYKKCKSIGINFGIVSAKRSFEEQKNFYNKYYTIYGENVEPPGNSVHEIGMAIDIKIGYLNSYNNNYKIMGLIWENMGKNYFWGGNNCDEYWHFSIQTNE